MKISLTCFFYSFVDKARRRHGHFRSTHTQYIYIYSYVMIPPWSTRRLFEFDQENAYVCFIFIFLSASMSRGADCRRSRGAGRCARVGVKSGCECGPIECDRISGIIIVCRSRYLPSILGICDWPLSLITLTNNENGNAERRRGDAPLKRRGEKSDKLDEDVYRWTESAYSFLYLCLA